MLLKKKTGGATIGEYAWVNAGDVTEVPDALGLELLDVPSDEFTEITPDAVSEPEPEKRRPGRPRKTPISEDN